MAAGIFREQMVLYRYGQSGKYIYIIPVLDIPDNTMPANVVTANVINLSAARFVLCAAHRNVTKHCMLGMYCACAHDLCRQMGLYLLTLSKSWSTATAMFLSSQRKLRANWAASGCSVSVSNFASSASTASCIPTQKLNERQGLSITKQASVCAKTGATRVSAVQ